MSAPSHLPKVLLVDDERDITDVLKKGLEQHGLAVDVYNDPERALTDFNPEQYAVNVLDIRMPKLNGFDMARKIWKKQPDAQVCFLSAFEIYPDEADKVFKDFNTRCFVKKPTAIKALAEHLLAHIESKQ